MEHPACIVVGAGPAGAMLSLLLARRGVSVHLLEEHADFERDFRGDTVHPSTLEVLDHIGLADDLLKLPHGEMSRFTLETPDGVVEVARLESAGGRFPFVALLPQARFLEYVTAHAAHYPSFQLTMRAHVHELLEEGGAVCGVRVRDGAGFREFRAPLVVAADGRFSRLRALSGLQTVSSSAPMDVLWFRLPKKESDPADAGLFAVGGGGLVVTLTRPTDWQVGLIIPKGGYAQLKQQGLEAVRTRMARIKPLFADRLDALHDWHQVSLLSVESSRVTCWHRPGLLLIGDAAHVMTPVGGVGINVAIQDAVAAAELLEAPLLAGRVTDADLAAVQDAREWAARVTQFIQRQAQNTIVAPLLATDPEHFRLPLRARVLFALLRHLPFLKRIPAHFVARGLGFRLPRR